MGVKAIKQHFSNVIELENQRVPEPLGLGYMLHLNAMGITMRKITNANFFDALTGVPYEYPTFDDANDFLGLETTGKNLTLYYSDDQLAALHENIQLTKTAAKRVWWIVRMPDTLPLKERENIDIKTVEWHQANTLSTEESSRLLDLHKANLRMKEPTRLELGSLIPSWISAKELNVHDQEEFFRCIPVEYIYDAQENFYICGIREDNVYKYYITYGEKDLRVLREAIKQYKFQHPNDKGIGFEIRWFKGKIEVKVGTPNSTPSGSFDPNISPERMFKFDDKAEDFIDLSNFRLDEYNRTTVLEVDPQNLSRAPYTESPTRSSAFNSLQGSPTRSDGFSSPFRGQSLSASPIFEMDP